MLRIKRTHYVEPFVMLATLIRWLILATIVGAVVGTGTSLFLRALLYATWRTEHIPLWLQLILLPAGGIVNGLLLYYGYRRGTLQGEDSVIKSVHDRFGRMPLRTVLVKPLAAIITLACGGSAGKEGPCAHLGGTLSSAIGRLLRVSPEIQKRLVTCGISAGFASVFGTPLAGTVYGIELLTIGLLRHDLLFPAFVASFTAFGVSRWFHIPYHYYTFQQTIPDSEWLFLKMILIGIACGLASWLFIEMNERSRSFFGWLRLRFKIWPPAVPFLGGLILSIMILFLPTDYLGLSLPLMDRALDGEHVAALSFVWKIIFVAITLGSGFYGGIVTPQFVIGATAGNVFAHLLHMDPILGAAVGTVSVVAASSNTLVAAIIMGFELFGSSIGTYVLAACIPAYLIVGHRSVYPDQLVAYPKSLWMYLKAGVPLKNEQIHVSYGVLRRIRRWQNKYPIRFKASRRL